MHTHTHTTYMFKCACVSVRGVFIQNWCFHARALCTAHAAHTGRGSTGRPHSRPHSRSAARARRVRRRRRQSGRLPPYPRRRRPCRRYFSPTSPTTGVILLLCSYLILSEALRRWVFRGRSRHIREKREIPTTRE